MKTINRKFSALLGMLVLLATLMVACGDNTATPVPATTTTAAATTAAATTAAATTAAATTAAATTAAATTAAASGAGVTVDVGGTKVTIKPGGGQKFQPKSQITVTIWSSQVKGNGERLAAIMKDFEAANPMIKVTIDTRNDTFTYNDILKALTQSATAGGMPNIATGYENWVPAFVDSKLALGLNKFISGQYGLSQKDLEDYRPNMLARGIFPQYNNETYSWLFSNSGPVMYYNQDLITQYGLKTPDENYTWDQFVADSKTVTEKSGGKTIGYIFPTKSVSELVAMPIYARGGQIFDYQNNKFLFDQKPALDQINMLYDGVKAGYFATSDPGVANDNQNKFIKQQSLFYLASTSSRSFVADAIAKGGEGIKAFNWNATVPPHAAGVKPVTTLYGGAILGFKGKSDDEDLATWEVMKFMGSSGFQAKWASASGYVPATKSTVDDPTYKTFLAAAPQNKIPLVVYDYANASEPKLGQWQQVRDIVDNNVDALFQGKGTPADTVKAINDQANATLKK
ncbi:extracellular solute-binding protein [Candidatus Chlorohelix sp.]|uniref:extracellular solute-binding protein n=1 Tax=Candidatus Chlorohelix sp. TaxID=3139201 RepID=UPI00304753F9